MTKPKTDIERDALSLRDAGYDHDETAHITGMAVAEVRALWLRNDEEEDDELNAICDVRQDGDIIEVDIDTL